VFEHMTVTKFFRWPSFIRRSLGPTAAHGGSAKTALGRIEGGYYWSFL